MTLVDELGKQFVQLRIELKYPPLKILQNAYVVAPQEKVLEIKKKMNQYCSRMQKPKIFNLLPSRWWELNTKVLS
jgi:hypothetical protein